MTTDSTSATNAAGPLGSASSEGLGPLPERARLTAAHLLEGIVFASSAIQNEHGVRMNAARDLQACAAEIERLREALRNIVGVVEMHPVHLEQAIGRARKIIGA